MMKTPPVEPEDEENVLAPLLEHLNHIWRMEEEKETIEKLEREIAEYQLSMEIDPLQHIAMAQSVPPGDIQCQPNDKIVFNTPYTSMQTSYLTVINSSARRIGYCIKTTIMKRLGVDPPCGVIDPKKAVLLAVSCDAFAYGQEDTSNDRVTIEWTNTPDGAAQQFRREWFQGNGMVRRKTLWIEYKGVKPEEVVQTTPEDKTQDEKSAEGSPELTLTSKLTHMNIRLKEEEEDQEKKKSEEVQEKMMVEQKQKKETKDVYNSRSSPPQLSLIQLINIITPYIHAILPQEKCSGIDELMKIRASKRKHEVIVHRRLHHSIRNVWYAVEETAKMHSYKSNGINNFTVSSLIEHTKKLLRQLSMETLIDDWEVAADDYQDKSYDYERLISTIQTLLKDI